MEQNTPTTSDRVKPEIGMTVTIGEKVYTLSERVSEGWVLYRERIDGSAETLTLTNEELEHHLN